MKIRYALLLLISLAACKDQEQTVEMQPPEIPVFEVQQQDVPIYNELAGQIYGQKDIPIRARVDGLIEKISFEEGSRVKRANCFTL